MPRGLKFISEPIKTEPLGLADAVTEHQLPCSRSTAIPAPVTAENTVDRSLERPRQIEHVLGKVGKNQVGRDRRHEVQAVFPEFSFHVVLRGETEAAVRLQ